MNFIHLIIIIGVFYGITARENAEQKFEALLECYNTTEILSDDNKLPHNMHTLIAILRKIEDNPEVQMNLRELSVTLIHRFRQNGIIESPVIKQPGVYPFAPIGFQFHSYAHTLELLPKHVQSFPNNSISLIERCTLHSMLSNTIEFKERGDESVTCQLRSNEYRFARSLQSADINKPSRSSASPNDDVETLTPEELETIKNKNNSSVNDSNFDPNWFYPALPPNHPKNAQIIKFPDSRCPIEKGVISTEWKTISGGPLIAGIAAGLQFQDVQVGKLLWKNHLEQLDGISTMTLDNKWLATVGGDLAEVAIRQASQHNQLSIGVKGHWNSSTKRYFITDNHDVEFTAAEIRGDLDGLILATAVDNWNNQVSDLKLSQILDMYYSNRGVFNTSIRACNRRSLLTAVAPNETISAQVHAASVLLRPDLKESTFNSDALKQFALRATNDFLAFVPSMNDEPTCPYTESTKTFINRLATDLTIVIDTTWEFFRIQDILAYLLENSEINKYNSNFTLVNGWDGEIMINSSNSILDFYIFNETKYNSYSRGFNLATTLAKLAPRQEEKLNKERDNRIGGQRSDILLFIPNTASPMPADGDKEYCKERIRKMNEDVPDAVILFLAPGSNNWAEFTKDSQNDVVSVNAGSMSESRISVITLVNRMKRVPRRLINSQCGANFDAVRTPAEYTNYLEPSGINFYRLHPNYFYSSDAESVEVKIRTSSGGNFTICESRNLIHINTTDEHKHCSKIDRSDTHTIKVSCSYTSYIHDCNPLYLSIAVQAIDTNINRCASKLCRYPDAFKYTISYSENMKCTNSTSSIIVSSLLPLIFLIYLYFH